MATTQAPPARLEAGDPLPGLALLDAAGDRFDLRQQAVAGRTLLLLLAPGLPSAGMLAGLAAVAREAAAVEAMAFVVAVAKPGTGLPRSPVPILLDPERRLAAKLGVGGAGIVVVDPRGRVAAVLPGDALAEALGRCRTLHEASAPVVRRSGAPVLIVPGVLEEPLCAQLMAYWQAGEKHDDLVASRRDPQGGREAVKKRRDVMVQDRTLFALLKGRLQARVLPELKRAFGFVTASSEALRVGCYDAASGGFFARHRDNSTPYTAHRGFAMSLNLNTGAYEGGQLRFPEFGRELYEAGAGGAVLFGCSLLHEALPVTRGRRFALFTFFADAAGAARERQLIEQAVAAGRTGVTLS